MPPVNKAFVKNLKSAVNDKAYSRLTFYYIFLPPPPEREEPPPDELLLGLATRLTVL